MSTATPTPAPRVRVLHVITRLIVGGAQETAMLICQHLDRTRFDCELATGTETGPEGELHAESRKRGIALRFVPSLVRNVSPLHDFVALFKLARLMREGRYDIVHLHSSKAGILGRVAARLAGIPVVIYTVHGWGFIEGEQGWLVAGLFRTLERWCAGLADALVVVASVYREEGLALGLGRPEQYHLHRSGIELEQYRDVRITRDEARARIGIPADALVIGNVGRLSTPKYPEHMVEAFARLASRHPKARLVLVGDGWQRTQIEAQIAALDLGDRVHLLGLRRDVPELLRAFDVFVVTSSREGLPRTVPQAMAAALPVVATRVGGIPDAVEDGANGFLVPFGDLDTLTERLERLLRSPELRSRLGAEGLARVDEFSAETMVRRTEALYERLLHERHVPTPRTERA